MHLIPRDDIHPDEGCFKVVSDEGKIIGYIQIFKDESVGYWRELLDQAKPAKSVDVAIAILTRERDRVIKVASL